ncbi:MAG TPA: hypothetical protein DD670_20790, partial [Planctomycetaceae bacterium]|nr:hypothetical protein [Planctomycetaceae bacterium]
RDYFSRREQGRLLLLVMSLGLIVFLMNEVRKPEHWHWLIPEKEDVLDEDAAPGQEIEPSDQPIQPPSAAERETAPPDTDEPPSETIDSTGYFPGVKPLLLETIHDKDRFRSDEQEAWFHLFQILKTAEPAELRQASIGRVARIQLLEQSKAYRGELITVRGTIRRAHRLAAPNNQFGIAGYYQLWVWPDESPDWPIVVYCLELPDGFPTGMSVAEEATLTGFYFKLWLCKTRGGLDLIPVVLAGRIEWRKPAGFLDVKLGPWAAVTIVVGAALAAVFVVSYVYRRTRRTKRTLPATVEIEPVKGSSVAETTVGWGDSSEPSRKSTNPTE